MCQGEAFIGICATAAVVDPLEVGFLPSLAQDTTHPATGVCGCAHGLIGLCFAQGVQIPLKTFPSLCWCPPELRSELAAAAVKVGVWEILVSGYLEIFHLQTNPSSWQGRLSVASVKVSSSCLGLMVQKWAVSNGSL